MAPVRPSGSGRDQTTALIGGAHKDEERAPAPRRLPAQAVAQSLGVDRGQGQILSPGEPLGRRFRRLLRGREMDEAVGAIGSGAGKDAGRLGL